MEEYNRGYLESSASCCIVEVETSFSNASNSAQYLISNSWIENFKFLKFSSLLRCRKVSLGNTNIVASDFETSAFATITFFPQLLYLKLFKMKHTFSNRCRNHTCQGFAIISIYLPQTMEGDHSLGTFFIKYL